MKTCYYFIAIVIEQFKIYPDDRIEIGRITYHPKINISSTDTYINNITLKKVKDKDATQVNGLPSQPRLSNFSWSPNEQKVAFTHTTTTGVEIWVLDVESKQARKLTEAKANANMGSPISWFRDSEALLVRMLPKDRPALINTQESVPTGPTVTTSDGTLAQNRTYQDLLKNPNDEANFEALATSELYKVTLDGTASLWKEKAMYAGESFSPDGNYLMISTLHRPFSYIVPLNRFPSQTHIYDVNGKLITLFDEQPLIEDMPKGFMATVSGKRNVNGVLISQLP